MLKIEVLGGLRITRDGTELDLPHSRKTRALLAYLVLTGRPHSRERLVSLFWEVPDDPRGALRWSLTKIRGLVDEPERKRLRADRDSVAFDFTEAEVDLLQLRSALSGDTEKASTEELQNLAAAMRGTALDGLDLPDCADYHAWFVAQQEDAQNLLARLHETLAERLQAEPATALDHARTLVTLWPYDGNARARLVELLAACGRRKEAEAQRDEAVRMLSETEQEFHGLLERMNAAIAAGGIGPAEAAKRPDAGDGEKAQYPETHAMIRRPAVAVLPFDNISGDPEQDFLAMGITDDLITALSCWRWFPVIARTTVFEYQKPKQHVVSIGRELGARYVVQGSLRRAGDRVRVVAQLIDAERGVSIWAQRYDRDLESIFDLQQEIADRIASCIEPELARAEQWRIEKKSIGDLRAWDLNIRAVSHILRGNPENLDEAMRLLDESLKREPESSYTYSLRAFCMYHRALLIWKDDDPTGPAQSYIETARKSVALDESNWLGHALLGMALLWGRRDYLQAVEEERRAVELNPTAALAHQFMGCIRNFDGNPAQAIPHLEASLRLNPGPTSATLLLADLALSYLLLEDYETSENYARQAISKFEGNTRAWERLAAALGHHGRHDEAREALSTLTDRQGPLRAPYLEMTYPFRTEDHRARLWEGLRSAGWRE